MPYGAHGYAKQPEHYKYPVPRALGPVPGPRTLDLIDVSNFGKPTGGDGMRRNQTRSDTIPATFPSIPAGSPSASCLVYRRYSDNEREFVQAARNRSKPFTSVNNSFFSCLLCLHCLHRLHGLLWGGCGCLCCLLGHLVEHWRVGTSRECYVSLKTSFL